jgi:hypothetical protein
VLVVLWSGGRSDRPLQPQPEHRHDPEQLDAELMDGMVTAAEQEPAG